MNGVHDMGGMHGLGRIEVEENEPVFHEPWEGRVIAMRRATAATGKITLGLREAIENLPAADYLRMSYYQKWFASLVEQLVASGLATRGEIATGKAAEDSAKFTPAITAATAPGWSFRMKVPDYMLALNKPRRFAIGQRVRARNMHPVGHTRLPRYVRGHVGTVYENRGAQTFPDTQLAAPADPVQHVYCLRFAARELWGDAASPRDSVYLDLWEDYLEPA